jgi:hypothetical protein
MQTGPKKKKKKKKCVTAVKVSNFTGHYLPNCSTLDIGVLGFFSIV